MYIVIEIQDGVVGGNVWTYERIEDAYSKMHAVLSVAAVSSVAAHSVVMLNSLGERVDGGYFTHNTLLGEE